MTCAHVLGIIDAGPFADCRPGDLDAAHRHAQRCPTCTIAFERAAALTAQLQAFPAPAPPPDLTRAVLARIARIDDKDAAGDAVASAAGRTRSALSVFSAEGRLLLMTLAGAVAAAMAIGVWLAWGPPLDVLSGRIGDVPLGKITTRTQLLAALGLLAGLWLFISGVFSPLDRVHPRR
jgi:hypothetical protein